MSEQEQQPQASSDLTGFIQLVLKWHHNTIAQIDHIANIPESEVLEVTDEDTGEVRNLTGEQRESFIQGMLVAKTMFMQLPFQPVEVEPTDEA